MVLWLHFTRLLFFFVLLAGSVCNGAEPPPPRTSSTGDSESRRRQEEQKLGKNHSRSDIKPILQHFKIATDGGLPLLPVEINGKRHWFVLDTGATQATYDSCFRSLLGEPIKSKSVLTQKGNFTFPIFRSPEIRVGKLAHRSRSDCTCVDLKELREGCGQDFEGILGMDFLRKHIIRVDFDRGELTFLTKIGSDAGQEIPIRFIENAPYVRFEISGMPAQAILLGNDTFASLDQGLFLVDTGSMASGSIKDVNFDMLVKRGFVNGIYEGQCTTIAGVKTSRSGFVRAAKLADFRHQDLIFHESALNILGLDYWSRYLVTFDFPNRKMYLKKGSQFDKRELIDWGGVGFRRKNGKIVVECVCDESPAARAGIKPQDVLLRINDDKASEMSLMRIRRLLSEKGREYRLLLQRREKKLDLTIDLCK